MKTRAALAMLAVYAAWALMDFVIHGMILGSTYEQLTDTLFRPMDEAKVPLLQAVTAVSAVGFVLIYVWLVAEKSMPNAITYGAVFGVIIGMGMGYGTYSVMPIPYKLAISWFLASVVKALVGGILLGLIVKPAEPVENGSA